MFLRQKYFIVLDHSLQVVGWPLTRSGRAEGQCLMVLQFLRQLHLKGKVNGTFYSCRKKRLLLKCSEGRGVITTAKDRAVILLTALHACMPSYRRRARS